MGNNESSTAAPNQAMTAGITTQGTTTGITTQCTTTGITTQGTTTGITTQGRTTGITKQDTTTCSTKPDTTAGIKNQTGQIDEQQNVAQSTEASGALVIASIDFGTTYSGYAFMFKGTADWGHVHTTRDRKGTGIIREPTCVLLNNDKTFHSFGTCAIENYNEMTQRERNDYYFFRHFKMALYEEQKLSRKTKLHDQTGKELDASTVFAAVLSYFKTEIVEHVQSIKLSKSNEAALTENEFRWMITIPAIWSDSARQFMREAATNAGFDEEQVRLVLEPEAASLFCREQPMTVTRFGTVEPLEMGHKYILADLGGGTADICTHEVIEDGKLRELYRATGEYAGGLKVNDEFIQFLISLFGGEVVGKYKSNYARLYFELLQKFEVKKRMFKMTTKTVALFLDSDFVKLIKTVTEENIEDIIWNSKYRDNVEFLSENHKLIVSNTFMRGLFEGSVKEIISKLKEILSTCSSDNISTLLLAGGYSESPYVVARIKEELNDIHIVQVIEPSLAVMKGAAMMGLKPKNIIERRSRFTFGFSTGNTFVDGVHPEHLKFFRDGKVYCKHIFKKLIEQNQVVKYQETFTTETSNTFRAPNSKQLVLRTSLWRSTLENPTYCTEEDKCEMVGIILHRPPSAGWPDEVVFKHQLIVGETEFTVKVFNKMTGEEYEAQMDFL